MMEKANESTASMILSFDVLKGGEAETKIYRLIQASPERIK